MSDKPVFDEPMMEMIGKAFSGKCPIHDQHCPTCGSGRKNARGTWGRCHPTANHPYDSKIIGMCEDAWHGDEGREYYNRLLTEQAERERQGSQNESRI